MVKIVNGQRYLNGKETMELLGTSKQSFYDNAKRHLKPYHFDAKRTAWYSEVEVLNLKNGVAVRKGAVRLSNIQQNWMQDIIAMGYNARTENRGDIEIVTLPEDAINAFHLPPAQQFAKRSRMTVVDNAPICIWSSYYPLHLVEGDILEEMHHSSTDVVQRIKDKHGAVIRVVRERYTARATTPEEQALLRLVTTDPVLILQRASYTQDKQSLVLFSDMTLLGSWFASEREYNVDTWG